MPDMSSAREIANRSNPPVMSDEEIVAQIIASDRERAARLARRVDPLLYPARSDSQRAGA
jgi:hypothetical protein